MMALDYFPAIGTTVEYVGSLTDQHGTYVVAGECECAGCEKFEREVTSFAGYAPGSCVWLILVGNGVQLDHVRLASINLAA
jgi:hypothetical protein